MAIADLAARACIPCRGGVPPLAGEALSALAEELGADWQVVDEHHLSKQFEFSNFVDALAYVNRLGELAEAEGHHPDLTLSWGKVGIEIWTHKINGLTASDFVWAAKAETLRHP